MYLLDTSVVSELRRPRPHPNVLAWIEEVPAAQLFLSAVTIGEIQAGMEITRDQDQPRAEELGRWLDQVAANHAVLPMEAAAFRLWAKLLHGKSRQVSEDAMIAATASIHELTVATRNIRDFEPFGVPLINPFGGPPHGLHEDAAGPF